MDARWGLFHDTQNFWAWADKSCGIWGFFGQTIRTHFGTVGPLTILYFTLFNHYLYKKLSFHICIPNTNTNVGSAAVGREDKKAEKIKKFVKKIPFCAHRNWNIWHLWSSSLQTNQTDWQKNTGSYQWKTVHFNSCRLSQWQSKKAMLSALGVAPEKHHQA